MHYPEKYMWVFLFRPVIKRAIVFMNSVVIYDFIYMVLWEIQSCKDAEEISGS